jgi:zinc protease
MPLDGLRLTGFCAASKLFFTASQVAFKGFCGVRENFQAPRATPRIQLDRKLDFMTNQIVRRSCLHFSLCLLLAGLMPFQAGAQTFPEPVREHLLNGLTVLLWQRPGDAKVLLKLRVHSGAAFDLAGKGGTMALLDDALFPDPSTGLYVREQLGGQFELATNYDSIDVTLSGTASEFERMVELLRGALVTTQLTPENVATIRTARLEKLREQPASPAQIADQAIAARMFGNFPYGHPATGTIESLSKVDRADLLFARERFLIASNATLVVAGPIDKARAMRAIRQLLGPWGQGDRIVPATFRQPDPPDARALVVNQPGAATAEIRLAVRGLTRSDGDNAAAALVGRIARERWQATTPELSSVFARHEAHALPGIFVLGASAPTPAAPKAIAAAREVMRLLSTAPPTLAEIERARNAELLELSQRTAQTESIADRWLDIETFKLAVSGDQMDAVRRLSGADLRRVAARLFKDASVATVVVGNYDQLKAGLGATVELRVEKPEAKAATDPAAPAKKP